MRPDAYQAALDAIERGLQDTLTLAELARVAHVSPHHFARMFRATFGISVIGYVRGRRLAKSAAMLEYTKTPIVDIALSCGFGSHEAFTRAFKRPYGLSPSAYRRNASMVQLKTQERLFMSEAIRDLGLTPTFEDRDRFFAIGAAGDFTPGASAEIGMLWSQFAPRMGEIGARVGEHTYGLCLLPAEGERDDGKFTYVASVEVSTLDDVPEGMIGVEMPAKRYAVFAYEGGIGPQLGQAMQYIFGHWLPNSEYALDGADFEYYDERFDAATGTGIFLIYVPVRGK